MHTKSGLWEEAVTQGIRPQAAVTGLVNWLIKYDVNNTEPLCGSSVQFDRNWLDYHMPEVISHFSYRNIDISTVKELCRRYNPELYKKIAVDVVPLKDHRVMSDLDDTIAEFKFYRDNFLFWQD